MATATIKKRTGDWFAETESVTLVLTAEEAAVLKLVFEEVGGCGVSSPRKLVDSVLFELNEFVPSTTTFKNIKGELTFRDSNIRDYFK